MEDGGIVFEQKNKFSVGDRIEVMKPSGENLCVRVESMYNSRGESVASCPHPKEIIRICVSHDGISVGDIMRVKKEGEAEGGSAN